MTPTDLETAARHACKLLDLNPDGPAVFYGKRIMPYWEQFLPRVREAWAIQEGIRHAASQAQAKAFNATTNL